MNKQELIDELKRLLAKPSEIEGSDYAYGHNYGIRRAIIIAKQLGEPEKPKVPQFVADWVAKSREYDYEFCDFFDCNYQSEEVYRWLNCENRRQSELNSLALSTLVVHGRDAVIVEEEKLYTVEIPNPNSAGGKIVLNKQQSTGKLILEMLTPNINKPKYLHLTESEIKEDFEWAWQWAKEV